MIQYRFDVDVSPSGWTFNKIHTWELALMADCPKAAWRLLTKEQYQTGTQTAKLTSRDWRWYGRQAVKHTYWTENPQLELYVAASGYARKLTFKNKMDLRKAARNIVSRFRYDAWYWYDLDLIQSMIGINEAMCLICDCLLYGDVAVLRVLLELAGDDQQ